MFKENLAKFGQKKKIKKLQDSSCNLTTCWKLLFKYDELRFFLFPHNVMTWALFSFLKNTLSLPFLNLFFSCYVVKICPRKITLLIMSNPNENLGGLICYYIPDVHNNLPPLFHQPLRTRWRSILGHKLHKITTDVCSLVTFQSAQDTNVRSCWPKALVGPKIL